MVAFEEIVNIYSEDYINSVQSISINVMKFL